MSSLTQKVLTDPCIKRIRSWAWKMLSARSWQFKNTEAELLRHSCSLQAILFQSLASNTVQVSWWFQQALTNSCCILTEDSCFLMLLSFPSERLTEWLIKKNKTKPKNYHNMVFHHFIFRIWIWDQSKIIELPLMTLGLTVFIAT